MSDQQHMDDFFKQGLENYAPPVPGGMWERIVEERKKKRIALVWWRNWRNLKILIFFIAAGLIAGGSFLLSGDKATPSTPLANAKQQSGVGQSSDTKSILESNGHPVVKQSITSTLTTVDDNNNNMVSATVSTNQHRLLSDKRNSIANGNSSSEEMPVASSLNSLNNKTDRRKRKSVSGKISTGSSAVDIETAAENREVRDEESPTTQPVASALYKQSFDASVITAASLADSNKVIVSNNIKGPDCPEAEKNAAGNKTYWEAYASADYANKTYTDTVNSLFAAKRKETASFHSAFSFGARVTKVFSNGVSVRTGLNFSQINEKFSYVQSNTVQTTYIIDALTGDTTGSYIVRGTKYKTSFNRYRTLDVPMVLGYEVGNGRLHANFNAGAMINLYSWQKGELLDTAFQPVNITTGKGMPAFQYKTNIGVGFTAGASVYYKLNDRLHLLAEPYFRYNFSPMNKEALSLQERFTTIGLRFGIRIDF